MDQNTSHIRFIKTVIENHRCGLHQAEIGMPCWFIAPMGDVMNKHAICNKRAKRAGFVGTPTPKSLRKH